MAGMKYNYDENASSWPYFVLTVLIVAAIPISHSYISALLEDFSSASRKSYQQNGQIDVSGDCKTPIDSDIEKFKRKNTRSKIFNKKLLVLVLLFSGIITLFVFTQSIAPQDFSQAFDPFEILDIDSSASDREIRSHYRKLSLVYHPDKISRDTTESEKQALEAKFVLINKAYKALTDEVTKRNYEEYGHPDGPQDVSHGIALPSWFVEGTYSWILASLYIVGIAVLLPLGVGKWWSMVQSYTKKGIHVDTAAVFASRLLNHNPAKIVTIREIFKLISQGAEYQLMFNGKKTAEDVYEMLLAYTNRDFAGHNTVDVLKAVAIAPTLIAGLIDIASTFRNTELVMKSMEANKSIIQAVNPSKTKYYQLLQLPYVDADKIDSSFAVYTIPKLLQLSKEDQKKFLQVNDSQLTDILSVASKIPYMKLVKGEFKVPGETVLPPSSHAHLSLKVLVKSAADKKQQVVSKESLEEEDDFEALRDPFKVMATQPPIPPTNAPYFPASNVETNGWMCALINQRDHKLADVPQHFQRLSFANLEQSAEKAVVGIIKARLASTTPPEVGKYPFRCVLKSLDYFGNDLEFPIVLEVEDPPATVTEKDAYEIEDPDEDSVAGVMAALKGEAVKRSNEYESSDEESDSEEAEEESDFTDINTDTEDESDLK